MSIVHRLFAACQTHTRLAHWRLAASSVQCSSARSACRALSAAQMAPGEAAVLSGKEDAYDGVIIDPDCLPAEPAEFGGALRQSLTAWKAAGKRGIWLKVPATASQLIAPAVQGHGFEFHHAEPGYCMLTRWLPEHDENKLPPAASHQVGVGAFVMNAAGQVLVVQEKNGPLRGQGVWKMPTGLVQAGEDITVGAEREVLEETGIRARFAAVLAMRQAHGFAFGKSDFFFVLALTPEPGEQELVMQEDELVGVQWVPLDEFLSNPFMTSRPLFRKILDCCGAYARGEYAGLRGHKLETGSATRQDLLLFGESGEGAAAEEDVWIGLDRAAAPPP